MLKRSYLSLWPHETPRGIAVATDLEIFQVRLQDEAFSFRIERPGSGYQNSISLWTQTCNLLLQYLLGGRQFHSQGHCLVLVHFVLLFSGRGSVWQLNRPSPHCALDPGWKEAPPSRICLHLDWARHWHACSQSIYNVVAQAMEVVSAWQCGHFHLYLLLGTVKPELKRPQFSIIQNHSLELLYFYHSHHLSQYLYMF